MKFNIISGFESHNNTDLFILKIHKLFHYLETQILNGYCGIIIVHGGSMFMDFVGYPYPRICPLKHLTK